MKVEAGRRYRLHRNDGLAPLDGVVMADQHGALVFRPDGEACEFMVDAVGVSLGIGRLETLIVDAAPPLRPAFGHDPDEFARLQRLFRERWDFATCAR